jgi:peptidoglycan/xylan/chitin deacetylase (PgdA/CDA1 family)
VVDDRTPVSGDLSLHISRSTLARQLDFLAETCDVVALRDVLEDGRSGRDRARVAITFDDAYVGALSVGIHELTRRGLPATIFACPGLLETETWWDLVAAAAGGEVAGEARRECLESLQGRGASILASRRWSAVARGRTVTAMRIASAEGLRSASEQPRIDIGSHSWSHPNLSAIDADALEQELRDSLEWLSERCESFVPVISYPYGLSSAAVEEAARKVGYYAGFCADGGWLPNDTPSARFSLPRFNVPAGMSLDGLRLRLAGFGLT